MQKHELESGVTEMSIPMRRPWLAGMVFAILLGAALSTVAFAGGADVSDDEIYADGVTLTTFDGDPLDIDGDGNVDLAIAVNAGGEANRSRYYPGNGDGTFQEPILLMDGSSSRIVAADLNGDTFIDLVQTRRDRTNILFLGTGAGDLDAGTQITFHAARTLGIAIGDLDNDGDLDIVTANGRPSDLPENSAQPNRFYLNNLIPGGTVGFTGSDISADEDVSRSIALVDLDGDGDLDIVVGNDHTTPAANYIYMNQFVETGSTTVSFGPAIPFDDPNELTTEILIGDLNDDGKPDIVVLNAVVDGVSSGVNRFFLNETTAGVFALGPGTDISADTDRTNGGELADFNGDGYLDLAVANFTANDPSQSSRNRLYLNQFAGTGPVSFAPALDISADEHTSHELAAADLNGDGHIDIVIGNRNNVADIRDRRYLNNGTEDPFTNVAPVIDAQAGDLQTDEETDLTIEPGDIEVIDPDNVFPHDFTLTVQPGDNYTVTDNTISPAAGFSGNLTVPVIVNDGTDDSDPFDLTVAVGEPPANNAPEFTSTAVTSATEGEAYSYDIETTDGDGDPLEITAPTLPGWLTLTDNGDGTASLAGTPGSDDVGDHDVSLEVSDGTDSDVQNFTVTVDGESAPPPPPPNPPGGGGGGGGSFGLFLLLTLLTSGVASRRHGRSI